jgi:hypothetical protein
MNTFLANRATLLLPLVRQFQLAGANAGVIIIQFAQDRHREFSARDRGAGLDPERRGKVADFGRKFI